MKNNKILLIALFMQIMVLLMQLLVFSLILTGVHKKQVIKIENIATPIIKPVQEIKPADPLNVEPVTNWVDFTATAYCACFKCCGKTDGVTASGSIAKANHTIAVDTDVIPFDTVVEIQGMGTYVAEDTGGAIKGNKIDIYFNTHQEALNFGKRKVKLFIKEK